MSISPSTANVLTPPHEEVNKLAVIVGINSTSSDFVVPLQYAENDAIEIAQTLQQPASNFRLLTPPLLDEKADSASVKRAVIKLAQRKAEQDFLLFYFSGHAMPIKLTAETSDIYLVTYDFNPEEVEADSNSHISLSWLKKVLYEQTEAGRVLIILDCAYSGNILQTNVSRFVEEEFNTSSLLRGTGNTRAILTATGIGGITMEMNGHGLLTGTLLLVLTGQVAEALDSNGRVDILSLYRYLTSKLSESSLKQGAMKQVPALAGEFGRDLILADFSHPFTFSSRPLQEGSPVQDVSTNPTSLASPQEQTQDKGTSTTGATCVTSQRDQENTQILKEVQALSQIPETIPSQTEPIEVEVTISALSDIPNNQDLLEFSDYAKAIVDLIKSDKTQKPLTIMIDAAWGMGKTTLMKLIQEELEKKQMGRSFPTVWFNAWKYDQEESVWAALVLTILQQVQEQFNMQQKVRFWWNLSRDRFHQNFLLKSFFKSLPYIFGLILILGVLIVVVWLVSGYTLQETINILILRFKLYVMLIGGGFLALFFTVGKDIYNRIVKPLRPNITKYVRGPNYEERVGFLAQFEKDFGFVVKAMTDGGKWPLVIFIDDLDRCAPAKCVEIVEAVNILLDTKYCVFLIGMDAQTVAGSIEAKYKDLLGYLDDLGKSSDLTLGERFLEKIVQINFRIPKAESKLLESFIDTSLLALEHDSATESISETSGEKKSTRSETAELIQAEMRAGKNVENAAQAVKKENPGISGMQIEDAKKEIKDKTSNNDAIQFAIHGVASYLDANPRKIKRFINIFRLQTLIASRRGLLKYRAIQLDLLAQWLIITMRWPDVVEAIIEDSDFISNLKDAYEAKERLRNIRRDSAGKAEEEVLERAYQARIDYHTANPYIKRLINATDLMILLNKMTNAQLLNYLYFTQTTL